MSETKQPEWKLIANLGDVNVAQHGGFLVYVDTTGVYPPEVELYEADDDETGGKMSRNITPIWSPAIPCASRPFIAIC